jgi:ParB family chromosome partitioning protein
MAFQNMGHNETTVRLGLLAEDARRGLEAVSRGEGETLSGWLAYGAALNEGRALFPSDELFGEWLVSSNLRLSENDKMERAAAMWAAREPEQFEVARVGGNARTVRGIYAKWQEIDAERKAAEERERAAIARAKAEEERAKAEAERKAADEARRKAEDERRRAQQRADAEAAAIRDEKRAKDEEQRRMAQAKARAASIERAEAERVAKEEDEKAKAADYSARESDRIARESDKTAKSADKSAKAAEKKADNAKKGSISDKSNPHVSNNSGENEWYTPAQFVDAARSVMGGFDLDPASSEVANRTVKAERIFTAQDDGLLQKWPIGRIWMNPPYAQPLMGQFASKFASEIRKGSEGVVLVNNATETAWFQEISGVCAAICFPKTRIRFLDPEGNASGTPLQGQAIIYCGPNVDAFEEIFAAFGLVLRHG